MANTAKSNEAIQGELESLRAQLEEAEETLRAIRSGEVDAVVVHGEGGDQVFTLKSADAPYRVLVEEMNDGAATLSADGLVLYCNRRLAEMLNTPLESIVGASFDSFVASGDRAAFAALLRGGRSGRGSGEFAFRAADQSPLPLHLSLSGLPANGAAAMCVVATDLTKHKSRENELRRAHDELEHQVAERTAALARTVQELGDARLAALNMMEDAVEIRKKVEAANEELNREITERKLAEAKIREQAALLDRAQDSIFVLDLNHRITYWNKGAERLMGWSASEVIGKNAVEMLFKGIVTPQLRAAMKATEERGDWTGELEEFTKDGRGIVVQGRTTLLRDEQNQPKGILVIDTDITEKKKLEMQFLRAQRLESIGTLAGGIAHDLNNVLAPLLMSVQLLKEGLMEKERNHYLGILEANIKRGTDLVRQVLTFSRGIKGERVMVRPDLIAREINQIVRETFPKSIEYQFHRGEDLWTITGDSTQIHQVLMNLCVNARDAMPQGGKLSVHLENRSLNASETGAHPGSKPGPYVVISVSDTGTGMTREVQEKMFDPFFTTKAPDKGTGLGLSTSLGIVISHGGFMDCQSEPGQGTTFNVYLPAVVEPVATQPAAGEGARLTRGRNELVLVVDDEAPIRRVAKEILEHFGYRVLLAEDGAIAVSLYQSRQAEISVVLTDLAMPVMDGPACAAAIKFINPQAKIIASSGLAFQDSMAKAEAVGVHDFIPKPYTAESVLKKLHEILHNGKAG